MNKKLNKIVNDLKISDLSVLELGLDGGLMSLSLFFFYYSRFISNETYENFAYEIFKIIVSKIDINTIQSNYIFGLSGIGICIDFLTKEKFIEIESEDLFEDFNNSIFKDITKKTTLDFSFQTGLLGRCNYFMLHKNNKTEEVIKISLDRLCSGFAVPDFPKHPIETIFLMPSEVLKDIELFLYKVEKLKIHEEQISLLKYHITKFEKEHTILQSNCFEYYKIQYLRKTIGFENKLLSKKMLDNYVNYISNKAIQGLTFMYYEKPNLPNIWKIL